MPTGGQSDFRLDAAAPVRAARCLGVPSRPLEPVLDGSLAWRCISHLSLNYLSLTDLNEQDGAVALREMLHLYARDKESVVRRHLEGVRAVRVQPITRRMPGRGPITFGRGMEVRLRLRRARVRGQRRVPPRRRCWRSSSPATLRSTPSRKLRSTWSVGAR